MAYAFVQSGTNSNTSGAVNLASSSITVTAGNTLICWILANGNIISNPPTGNSNAFTNIFVTPALSSVGYFQCWLCQNANSGATVITPQSSNSIYGIWVEEISGLVTTGGALGSIYAVQTDPGTGANAISTGNINATTVPAALFAFAANPQAWGGSNTGDPDAGTSLAYTARSTGWLGVSSLKTSQAEDIRVTSTGNIAATFTNPHDLFDDSVAGAILLQELPGPTPPFTPYRATQFFVTDTIIQT
jgi:hypothetical protein